MKKVFLIILLFIIFLTSSAKSVSAQNKAGINIGDKWSDLDQAAGIVGPGGWIVVMACPGDSDQIADAIAKHPNINFIIRGHYAGRTPNAALAKAWAATLGAIPSPNKIYFMPWNEPNQVGIADYGEPAVVSQYISDLRSALGSLMGSKVILLSPMMNPSNPSFPGYVRQLGSNFFKQFDGIALSLYDTCNGCGRRYEDPMKSPDLLEEMGASGKPIFGVESGTAGPYFYFTQPPNSSSYLYRFVNNFLSNSPGKVTMFAIASYDLAGERGHIWSLFNPPDVINLLRNSAKGGTTASSLNILPSQMQKCPGKNYSFYETSEAECASCGGGLSLNPEIIYPQSSNFCNEFLIEIKESSQSPHNTSLPLPAGSKSRSAENTGGNLTLDKNAFPDFEQMKKDMERAVSWLTPGELLDRFSIEGPSLETKAKHFLMGEGEEGGLVAPEKEKIPETKITQPYWFTQLLGSTRWICGIFGTCPAASSPEIKIQQANININYEAYQKYCLQTEPKIPEKDTAEEALQTQFAVSSWWDRVTEIIEGTVEGIRRFFIKEEKGTLLTNKTQGEMAGGANFSAYSDFQRAFIPQSFMEEFEMKTGPLATKENNYTISVKAQTNNYQKPINYSDKVKDQLKRCMALCSVYPAEFDISRIDPLCPSCNSADYPLQDIQVDKTNCHPQPGGGCDYKNDTASPSCEGDPVCESGKCYPNMYRMIGDYTSKGCTPPYPGNGCTLPGICESKTFKKNSAGGFGPCQYENPNVCVRADWKQGGIGRCDYLCNWSCCAYQK